MQTETIEEQPETSENNPSICELKMSVRWVEADWSEEQGSDHPFAVTWGWDEKTYYKLQQYFNGKWNDVMIVHQG